MENGGISSPNFMAIAPVICTKTTNVKSRPLGSINVCKFLRQSIELLLIDSSLDQSGAASARVAKESHVYFPTIVSQLVFSVCLCAEMRALRLTGGLDRCSGKVEIHRNGSWGTVCDNCWNRNMASMVCSMLQCGAEPKQVSQFVPPLIHNNGTLWFYKCYPNAQNLWQCKEIANKMHLCQDSKASGVICDGEWCLWLLMKHVCFVWSKNI